jgi:hypothetical protein
MRVAREALEAPEASDDAAGAQAIDKALAVLKERWQSLKTISDSGRWSDTEALNKLGDANQLLQRASHVLERAIILYELETEATQAVAGRGEEAAYVIRTLLILLERTLGSEESWVLEHAARLERQLMALFSQ